MQGTDTLTLILDIREARLAAECKAIGLTYTTANLDVGDILIQNADGEPLLVAERKSHADFAASNNDGRYREQRARLMAVRGSGVAVLYILEGTFHPSADRTYGRTSETQLKRLTSRLMLRYGMPVLSTESLSDTARWCQLLLTQLQDDPTVFHADDAAASAMSGFTAALNTVKKGNKTAAGTAQAMLSAIPGLGAKRVHALLSATSIADLVALSAEQIAVIQAGDKRLGDKLGAAIYECLRSRT